MGKNQKIKEQRKLEKIRTEIKKQNRIKFVLIVFVAILAGSTLGGATFWGLKKMNLNFFNRNEIKTDQASSAAKKSDKQYSAAPEMVIDVNKTYIAKFETNKGNFDVEFFTKDAPNTVNNFVYLARDNFYDGLTFHRVIKDFMIQGGDPKGDGTGGPGYKFEDEINSRKLVKGVLAMANSGVNTNGSQFFIVTAEATDWLDGKHTAFGNVISGLDVVLSIQDVATGENDKPTSDVVINKVTIEEK